MVSTGALPNALVQTPETPDTLLLIDVALQVRQNMEASWQLRVAVVRGTYFEEEQYVSNLNLPSFMS